MNKQYYPALDETLYTETLSNGLRILVVPKPGFTKKTCYLVTDYGAVHRDFALEGRSYSTPAGVAHYLEHKLFELPQRDVTGEFAALGAHVNAFTSYDLTAYYFSCTEQFDHCLQLLLEFVFTPYFPEESVLRERGIIAQEIGMTADEPGNQVFESLMAALYQQHPIRTPILGTKESIEEITPEILTLCHRAFYTPGNMLLCVIGDVHPEEIATVAEQFLGKNLRPMPSKAPLPQEALDSVTGLTQRQMEVAMPLFSLGFKCECPEKGEPAIRREVVGELAAETLFGEASALYMQLYQDGLIDSSFGGGFEASDGCAFFSCSGDSDDPQEIQQRILQEADRIARQGLDREEFLRMKRSSMGRRIRDLDSFDSTCFRLCAYALSDFDYFQFPALYDSIGPEEIQEFITRWVKPENCALTIIYPIKEETP